VILLLRNQKTVEYLQDSKIYLVMYLPLRIAKRYLLAKKSTNAINIISSISVVGMTVGTMALVVVLSVFNGFEDLVVSLYNSFNPEIQVTPMQGKTFVPDKNQIQLILKEDGVETISETLEENALLRYGDKQFIATIKGVDPKYEDVTGIDSTIIRGKFILEDRGEPLAIIGAGIEASLSINIRDELTSIIVNVPKRGTKTVINPAEAFSWKSIRPIGVFAIQQEFDLKYMVVPLSFARDLLNYENEVSSLEISLTEDADEEDVKDRIEEILGADYVVKDRYQQNELLFNIMKMEKWAVYLILSFILVIAAFNIIGSLSMLVIEKKKDISILMSMGASKRLVNNIFLLEGMLMSLTGTVLGFVLGLGICLAQQYFEIIQLQGSGSFVVSAYPVKMDFVDFILVFVTVVVISILASWYPARRAAAELSFFKEA